MPTPPSRFAERPKLIMSNVPPVWIVSIPVPLGPTERLWASAPGPQSPSNLTSRGMGKLFCDDKRLERLQELWLSGDLRCCDRRTNGYVSKRRSGAGVSHGLAGNQRALTASNDGNAAKVTKIDNEVPAAFRQPTAAKRRSKQYQMSTAPSIAAVTCLLRHSCRFPIEDPRRIAFRFCCRTTVPHSAYWMEHAAKAYLSVPRTEERPR